MATLRQVRLRIQGIHNTQKITRAMKIVAATKLRKLDRAQKSSKAYAQGIEALLREIALYRHEETDPLLIPKRKIKRVGFILLSSDRGLCGAFNINLFKQVLTLFEKVKAAAQEPVLYIFGQRGFNYFHRLGMPIRYSRTQLGKADRQSVVQDFVKQAKDDFLKGEIDQATLLYTQFQSTGNFGFAAKPFLPVRLETMEKKDVDFIYEGSYGEILSQALPLYLEHVMRQAFLESITAEEASRMMAMDYATENADTLIEELTLFYNRSRQAAITKELSEIIGGAEALEQT